MSVDCQSITQKNYKDYIEAGRKAYCQHYVYLWENGDASPYIQESFTLDALVKEDADEKTELFLIQSQQEPVGVLKIIKNKALHPYSVEQALLLDKIYFLNEHCGKGIGTEVLEFTEQRAKTLGKKIVWLETMVKGPALAFYLKLGFRIHSLIQLRFHGVFEEERPMYRMVKSI